MFHTKKPKERVRLQQARMGEGGGVELAMGFGWGPYIFTVNYVNLRTSLSHPSLDTHRHYNGHLNEDNLYKRVTYYDVYMNMKCTRNVRLNSRLEVVLQLMNLNNCTHVCCHTFSFVIVLYLTYHTIIYFRNY